MHDIIDLDRYPLDQPGSPEWAALVTECKAILARDGLFNLEGFMRPEAIAKTVTEVAPLLKNHSFNHARAHNIYFKKSIDGLAEDHPALKLFETSNNTVCADQIPASLVMRLYEWQPFQAFLAAVMDKPALYPMADPLACMNVMSYREGQALNWHFDRSEFTTTLLLQAPEEGGMFEYSTDLRSDDDPNYDGVAELVEGRLAPTRMPVTAGTLNIFKGKNTAHRVTPVKGTRDRIITVFTYYENPGAQFTDEERMGFYGRVS